MIERARIAVALAGLTAASIGGAGSYLSYDEFSQSSDAYKEAWDRGDENTMNEEAGDKLVSVLELVGSLMLTAGAGVGTAYVLDEMSKKDKNSSKNQSGSIHQ